MNFVLVQGFVLGYVFPVQLLIQLYYLLTVRAGQCHVFFFFIIFVERNRLYVAHGNAGLNTEVSNNIKSGRARVLTSCVVRKIRRP